MRTSMRLLSLSILLGSGLALGSQPALAGGLPGHAADQRVASNAEVAKLVEATLIEPLARREAARSRYSRVRMPAAARQVRVLEGATDPEGRTFVRFAVDEKRSAEWERNVTLGCAYPDDGAVFVAHRGRVQSAAQYLGKEGPRVTTECTSATVSSR
jgi:hypothetical protein